MNSFSEFRHYLRFGLLTACLVAAAGCGGGGGEATNGGTTSGDSSTPTSGSTESPQNTNDPLTVSSLNKNAYIWGTLDVGEPVYIDRSFSYTDVPENFAGLRYLQTRNDDKDSTGSNFINFDVSRSVTVYVAYDRRITSLPSWLNDWRNTSQTITTQDTTMRLYAKDFASGTVSLGGNEGSGYSMYAVILAAQNDEDRDGMADDWENANGLDPTDPGDGAEDPDGDGYTNLAEYQGNSNPLDGTSIPDVNPVAKNDSVSITQDNSIEIAVMGNDEGLVNTPISIGLLAQPQNGSATVLTSAGSIMYAPDAGFTGDDNFSYSLTDSDGDIATASVNITVNCNNGCAAGVDVSLSWAANPGTENIQSYQVYFGTTDVSSDMQIVEEITASSGTLNVNYDAGNELGLQSGQQICFRVRARNSAGLSPYSPSVCGII